jgi:hypothetical protein
MRVITPISSRTVIFCVTARQLHMKHKNYPIHWIVEDEHCLIFDVM